MFELYNHITKEGLSLFVVLIIRIIEKSSLIEHYSKKIDKILNEHSENPNGESTKPKK